MDDVWDRMGWIGWVGVIVGIGIIISNIRMHRGHGGSA
jgi:hypothetical protein